MATASEGLRALETGLDGALIVEPLVHSDGRGWFYEHYSERKYAALGINARFVQDNRSFSSRKGVVRGLHCQLEPYSQAKLVSCTRGSILDIAVDVRRGSPTYLKWIKIELSAENKRQLFIPRGFLHGFVTLTDEAELLYKADEYYEPTADRSVRFDDPLFGIELDVTDPILSDKDRNAPLFEESDVIFSYESIDNGR